MARSALIAPQVGQHGPWSFVAWLEPDELGEIVEVPARGLHLSSLPPRGRAQSWLCGRLLHRGSAAGSGIARGSATGRTAELPQRRLASSRAIVPDGWSRLGTRAFELLGSLRDRPPRPASGRRAVCGCVLHKRLCCAGYSRGHALRAPGGVVIGSSGAAGSPTSGSAHSTRVSDRFTWP